MDKRLLAPAAALLVLLASACSIGPTSKEDVCSSYQHLLNQVPIGNIGFGNPLFTAAGDLASVAGRYNGSDLSADATALQKIADADSTSDLQIINATAHIATLCGKSVFSSLLPQ